MPGRVLLDPLRWGRWTGMLLVLVTAIAGCNPPPPNVGAKAQSGANNDQSSQEQKKIISDFADPVIIPTYELLVSKAADLSTAVNTFVDNSGAQTLAAARAAWTETRTPWEHSKAFAFVPAESLGYDGDLDDWPVNETDVRSV